MDSDPRRHESSRRAHTDLKPLKTKCDVEHFLEAIREDFFSSVSVRESGLEDSLIQNGVLNYDSDVESLYYNHSSRKDKTRRLWFILHDVDHEIFINKALPVLCDKYYHIIPLEFWKGQSEPDDCGCVTSPAAGETAENVSEAVCFRCAVKRRVREDTMFDLLFDCKVITYDDYREYFSTRNRRESWTWHWDYVFEILGNMHSDSIERFSRKFQRLLTDYALAVPSNLEDSIKCGVPCTCSVPPEMNSNGQRWPISPPEMKDPWQRYYGPNNSSRSSLGSTIYPESEQGSESHRSYGTLGRSTISSCISNFRYLENEFKEFAEELADEERLGPGLENGLAGPTQANKIRYLQTWHGLSVLSVVNEAKRFLRSQQDMRARDTEKVSKQRAGRDVCKSVPLKFKGTFTVLQPDDLYKTFKIGRKAKRRRALREVFYNDSSTEQSFLLSSVQKGPVDATEELANSPPELSCESHAENLGATEELTYPRNEVSFESQNSSAVHFASIEECGEEEAMASMSIDDAEEIAILTELCDLVANCFSSQGHLNDHLKMAEEWKMDTDHSQTLTVTSCLEAEASLQGTLEKLEQMKEERLASLPQQNSLVQDLLMDVCATIRDSCLFLVLGLKASLLCYSILEMMQHLRLATDGPVYVKFTCMRKCARRRLRSGLRDIVNKVNVIAEQLKSLPGRFQDSFGEELSNLQTTLLAIDL